MIDIAVINPVSIQSAILLGLVGGFLPEMGEQYKLRKVKKEDYPDHFKSFRYWFWTLVMISFGGILVLIYNLSGSEFNPFLSINVGASAPLIIKKFSSITPDIDPGKVNS
jgi:hypothetical protein